MAKLSKPRPSFASTIRTDPQSWNPPIQTSKAQTSSRESMPPPQPRSSAAQSVPHTPSLQREQGSSAQDSMPSSGRKRSRRGSAKKKRKHRNSFREHTGSISTETTSSTQKHQTSIADESRIDSKFGGPLLTPLQPKFKTVQDERHERTSTQHGYKTPLTGDAGRIVPKQRDATKDPYPQHVLLNQTIASPPRQTNARRSEEQRPVQTLMESADEPMNVEHSTTAERDRFPKSTPTSSIPVEQQPVFEKEPEMFGIYAASDEESEPEDEMEEIKVEEVEEKEGGEQEEEEEREESNSRLESGASVVDETETSDDENAKAVEEAKTNHKPQIVSDVIKPTAPKLGNGRFACSFADAYDCEKTFSSQRSANRHAEQHTNADKYKCASCDKMWSRQDLYSRHMMNIHGEKVENLKHKAKKDTPTEKSHLPVLRNSSDAVVATKGTKKHRSVEAQDQTDRTAGDEPLRHVNISDSLGADHPPVTSAEEETESDEASDDEDNNAVLGTHINTAKTRKASSHSQSPETENPPEKGKHDSAAVNSASSASTAAPPSNKLKRKVPLLSSRSKEKTSHRPRKRHRGESPEQNEDVFKSQDPDVVVSDDSDAVSGSSHRDENKKPETSESDIDMGDAIKDNGPYTAGDEAASPIKANGSGTTPKVLVTVPKPPNQHQRKTATPHSKAEVEPKNTSRSSRQIAKPLPHNTTLDRFLERSEIRSSSVEATSSRFQQPTSTLLATTGQGELSKSRAEGSQLHKAQPRIDSAARKIASKSALGDEEDGLDEADESGTDLEDQPRATTVARRGLTRKGKEKSSARHSLKKPSAAQKTREKSEKDGDQDDDDADSSQPEEDLNAQKQRSKNKSKPRRISKVPRGGRTGRFSDEEIAILHAWRDSFCALHGLSVHEFNDMMTASTKKGVGGEEWRPYQNFIKKRAFLDEYYEQLPDRNRRAMVRFRERNFTNAEKGAWTAADDKELKNLVRECGSKWVEIAEIMGRTSDAVHQRWRHKLNSGEEIVEGKWTDGETEELGHIVTDMAQEQGKDADESDLDIKWKIVSQKLGNGRTAQQCSNRWRITTHKRTEDGFVRVPHADRIPLLKAGPRTPSKMSQRLTSKERTKRKVMPKRSTKKIKSAEYVDDSGDETDNIVVTGGDRKEAEEEVDEIGGEEVKQLSEATSDTEESTSDDARNGVSENQQRTSIKEETDTESAMEDDDPSIACEDNGPGEEDLDDDHYHGHEQIPESTSGRISLPRTEKRTQKTPAKPRRPFKTTTPANALSLTQLMADTQATTGNRPTTGKRSRVPDTEVRPERPSPVVSIKRRPVSSPLDMLAQVAAGHQSNGQDDEVSDEDSEEDSRSSSNSEEHYKSPATFTSAKSGQEDRSDEEFGGREEESDEDESAEGDEDRERPSQGTSIGFWDSINSVRNLLPFSQNSSSSQRAGGPLKQGRKSIMDALRGLPSKEDSSDNE